MRGVMEREGAPERGFQSILSMKKKQKTKLKLIEYVVPLNSWRRDLYFW
jgi:hypothetical protein